MKNTSGPITYNYAIPLKYHLVFWVLYYIFNTIRWGGYFDDYFYSAKSNLVSFFVSILFCYWHIYVLIPKYIVRKKIIPYIIWMIVSSVFFYFLKTGMMYVFIDKTIWPEAPEGQTAPSLNHFITVVLGELYVIAFVSAIKLTIDWISVKNQRDELQKLQLQTEIKYLRAQMQPHFFFNTLNSLYALTLKKSDNAPRVVVKLSEIMQYVLYEVQEPRIHLTREIRYINSYVNLEELRCGNIDLTLNIIGNIEEVKTPPLLFLPFIENCFKHGGHTEERMQIDLTFKSLPGDQSLHFLVKNTINPEDGSIKPKGGIGIKNVKRRLFLLYQNNFVLQTGIKKNHFVAYLKIPVKDN
ncbi:sensor histidine kinase [Sinomicrobium weinanense]|uniref:Sensor histidine kinase n=1 Tax=Sinomicrobium weinanense TaxID=2842200 RepID=A0A926JTB9_9FLAO|nr:sensor histidine kinase [Sinomicrobium weinanense]MBC9796872.1 sensor histidine kinase [Sinomicrobium weinanense]MBU3123877.1 sensor histidine kinase [Sinomicrobium weinanense]